MTKRIYVKDEDRYYDLEELVSKYATDYTIKCNDIVNKSIDALEKLDVDNPVGTSEYVKQINIQRHYKARIQAMTDILKYIIKLKKHGETDSGREERYL